MTIVHVVGARPNFPKMGPVFRGLARRGHTQRLIHTGQHYDELLSAAFFKDLGIPPADCNLEVGSASHAVQTARIMERLDPILRREAPAWVVVYGDVNSTVAAALVASKLRLRVAHVEAGLRSKDRSMPEEINRIVTDRLSDLLLTPSLDASETLRREGEPEDEIVFVGNVMIDSLFEALRGGTNDVRARLPARNGYVIVTLHRPSNVDDPVRLGAIMTALREIACERDVIFPVHPRARHAIYSCGEVSGNLHLIEPLSYSDMIHAVAGSFAVITDSGGLQEETSVLGVPCLTVRPNTERPITIEQGTNRLVPEPARLPVELEACIRPPSPPSIAGWDGKAGERAAESLSKRT